MSADPIPVDGSYDATDRATAHTYCITHMRVPNAVWCLLKPEMHTLLGILVL